MGGFRSLDSACSTQRSCRGLGSFTGGGFLGRMVGSLRKPNGFSFVLGRRFCFWGIFVMTAPSRYRRSVLLCLPPLAHALARLGKLGLLLFEVGDFDHCVFCGSEHLLRFGA